MPFSGIFIDNFPAYAAVREADDGGIFSKSVHGNNPSEKGKKWLLPENDANVFTDYTDRDGHFLFRLKSCVDTFDYCFTETDPKRSRETTVSFSVKEKRIVSYDPDLAKKQRTEIRRMADKAAK